MRAWIAAIALWCAVAPASAQPVAEDDERARVHFQAGSSHFDTGNYEAALQEFEAAYALSHRPALLYNIYLSHERLGNLEEAAGALRSYLEGGDVPEARREPLTERLRAL